MRNLSFNQRLATLAFLLAFAALLLAFMYPDGMNHVNEKPYYISVVALADQIKSRKRMRVIDLRAEALYEEFHIPTAEHLPLDSLLEQMELKGDVIVFYAGDDPLCRRLWSQLPDTLKQRSLILYGGVHDWYERLLYPKLPLKSAGRDSASFKQVHDLSLFYGGQADFVEEKEIMEYYLQDFSKLSWPKSHRQNGLVRKGC